MSKFLLRFFVFIIILKTFDILLSSFFTWSLQAIRYLDDDYGSINRMYNGGINADIIILGSSRTYLHINPEVVQTKTGLTTWNLAMDGTNFDQHKFTLEEYLLHNRTPKIVIFEADLTTLDKDSLRFKKEFFLPYINYSNHTLELFTQSWEDKLYYTFFSSAPYKQQIPTVLFNYKIVLDGIRNGGYTFETLTLNTLFKKDDGDFVYINGAALRKGQISEELPRSLPISSPINTVIFSGKYRLQEFEELANLAERDNFLLVLVTPIWLNGSIEESQKQSIVDLYQNIASNYENTYFLDYSYDELLSNDLSFWLNIGHLNFDGANVFSDKLSKDILDILSADQ
ncbi:MAG: DUF1574 domain-containing protein [Anaerolineales bacterium]|nr:DUF1574 domain-containing protein [Anaerolineales bacterium]